MTLRITPACSDVKPIAAKLTCSLGRESDIVIPITHVSGSNPITANLTIAPDSHLHSSPLWHLFLEVEAGGTTHDIRVKTDSRFRKTAPLRNIQAYDADGHILFPVNQPGSTLSFICRERLDSDSSATRAKELFAYGIWKVRQRFVRNKRYWVFFEKRCQTAQDNAFALFCYCMEHASPEVSKRCFYIIDPKSPDYGKAAEYGSHAVDFMSFKHMRLALFANLYVASDAKSHLYQWHPRPSLIRRAIGRKPMFFLQHGVTALKRVDPVFGKHGMHPMTYFLTTSIREQDIVVDHFGYDRKHAPILGFSRWDFLRDTSSDKLPTVFCMPTWRSWLEDASDEEFMSSDYYRAYNDLLSDARLSKLLEDAHCRMQFLVHPKLKEHLRTFTVDNPLVEIVDGETSNIQSLLMECKAVITYYSIICWDALYMDKPVVFYQPDAERYLEQIGSYIDFNTDLPGYIAHNASELVEHLDATIASRFQLDAEHARVAASWFAHRDENNRERTLRYILNEGY
ncbi:MAG: CDP-glycerol glycerophosphotransferase family protein [Coriobacteriia bacterium]|nr:CDP-glycerol glycerophosphotransferase family protein [Coriobacteriia bacterium]